MADVEVTEAHQRAADVPKVKREGVDESVAADAAKRIEQPAPRGANKRAEELAVAESVEDEQPPVEVKLSDDFEFPTDEDGKPTSDEVTINHPRGHFKIPAGGTVEVKAEVYALIEDNPFIEKAEAKD